MTGPTHLDLLAQLLESRVRDQAGEQPTPADLTAILTAHQFREAPPPVGPRCHCGFRPYGLTEHLHAAHVAEQITASGFGPVRAVEAERAEEEREHEKSLAIMEAACDRAEQAEADRDEAWRVAAQRRDEARRYYVAWSSAQMRARAVRAERDEALLALEGESQIRDAWRSSALKAEAREKALRESVEALIQERAGRGRCPFSGVPVDLPVALAVLRALVPTSPDREDSGCPSRCGWNDPCPDPWHDRKREGGAS